jgi:hypothetical protein
MFPITGRPVTIIRFDKPIVAASQAGDLQPDVHECPSIGRKQESLAVDDVHEPHPPPFVSPLGLPDLSARSPWLQRQQAN